MSVRIQPKWTLVKRVLVAVTAMAIGLGVAACGSGETSAHNGVTTKKGYADDRQAGAGEAPGSSALEELTKEEEKVRKNVAELTRKITNTQQKWDTIRYADPQYRAPVKDRQEMMNLTAERDRQVWKLKQIEQQIKELRG